MAMTETSVEDTKVSSQPPMTTEVEESHKKELLEQFYLTLNVKYLYAQTEVRSVVHERIERLFAKAETSHSWRDAYEIEQLLCFVFTEPQLQSELDRRLAEAKDLKIKYVDSICKEQKEGSPVVTPSDKRIILHQLLNDLQWFYSKRDQYRLVSKRLMLRVSLLFMVALLTFSLVLFIQFFAHKVVVNAEKADPQRAASVASPSGAVPNAAAPADAAAPANAAVNAPSETEKRGGNK